MISAPRLLKLTTACATLAIGGSLPGPANAQGVVCKPEIVTMAGKAKFRPFSKTKEREGRGGAMDDAIAKWQREVGAKYGEQWKMWAKAKDTSFNCAPTKSGKIIGSSLIGCTISGRPCSTAAAASHKAGAGDRRDDKGRPRDRDREVGGRHAPAKWPSDYEREMARQDQLAAEREKEEMDAYEREMALQNRLAAERERGRSREWEREPPRRR